MDKTTLKETQGLGECVCFNLKRAARLVTRAYDEALRGSGLRATQFSILAVLTHAGPLGVSALEGVLGTERTTLTRNLKHLNQMEFVTIGPGAEGDRRVKEISATPLGEEALLGALPRWREAQDRMLEHLGPDNWNTMLGGLGNILMMEHRETAGTTDK